MLLGFYQDDSTAWTINDSWEKVSSIDYLEFVTPPASGLVNNPYFVMDDLVIDIVRECTM